MIDDNILQKMKALQSQALARLEKKDEEPPPEEFRVGVCRKDTMNPYIPPVSKTSYRSVDDYINTKGFAAIFPQSYTPVSDYFKEYNVNPYYSPTEEEDYARGSLTIAGMIELTDRKQTWRLCRDEDVEVVIEVLTTYRDRMSNILANKPDANVVYKKYLLKVNKLLDLLDTVRDRMYRRHGAVDRNLTLDKILSVLSGIIK
jgi:hypothetical protein